MLLGPTALGLLFLLNRKSPNSDPSPGSSPESIEDFLRRVSPINRAEGAAATDTFVGDNPESAHRWLWSIQPKTFNAATAERAKVVVVGGGMSGLFSSYLLKDLNPILLEQAPRFGGNSRGASWQGIDYGIGAAYFVDHDPESQIYKLFQSLGLYEACRKKTGQDSVLWQGQFLQGFWEGVTDPPRAEEFRKVAKHFEDILHNRNGQIYPEIPTEDLKVRARVNELDRITFLAYMEKMSKALLHPHIATMLEHYCWSTLGAGSKDLSAAVVINELASEFAPTFAAPGGNGRIAELVLTKILDSLHSSHLRTDSMVLGVEPKEDHVEIEYVDANGDHHFILAETCVMACPKFVASRILRGSASERAQKFRSLRYHPYLVANIFINRPIANGTYDSFVLEKGSVDQSNPKASSLKQKTTDVIFSSFTQTNVEKSVLTLYRAFPWVEARAELLQKNLADLQAEFKAEIETKLLPSLNLNPSDVEGIQVSRWGHPMPLGSPGRIASGELEELHRPLGNRVFFVEQDNWMLPAIETCASEALRWAPAIRAAVAKA